MGEARFLFLTDMQLGCYASLSGMTAAEAASLLPRGMRVDPVPAVTGFAWDARRYEEAVQVVNTARPDAVVMGGDMVDDLADDDQIAAFLEITAGIDAGIEIHRVPGNHDIAFDGVRPTPAAIERYRAVFGPDHGAVRVGPLWIVLMNTPVLDHPEMCSAELDTQLAFLEHALLSPPAGIEDTILVGHHPLFLDDPEEPDSYWNIPMERRRIVLDLVERAGVRLGLAGHLHRNVVSRADGFEMVTSGAVGYPLGDDPSGYRLVHHLDGVTTHAYQGLDGHRARPGSPGTP